MYVALLVLHLLICLALVGVVLIQSGKGGGLAGGAFGGSAQTVFGGRGATDFITRATMILGGLFFLTSLVLAMMSTGFARTPRSVLQREARQAAPTAPARTPAGATPVSPGVTPAPTPTPQAPGNAPAGGAQPPTGGAQAPPKTGGK